MLIIPLEHDQEHPHGPEPSRAVSGELAGRFARFTAHTRAPPGGPRREDSSGTGRGVTTPNVPRASVVDRTVARRGLTRSPAFADSRRTIRGRAYRAE